VSARSVVHPSRPQLQPARAAQPQQCQLPLLVLLATDRQLLHFCLTVAPFLQICASKLSTNDVGSSTNCGRSTAQDATCCALWTRAPDKTPRATCMRMRIDWHGSRSDFLRCRNPVPKQLSRMRCTRRGASMPGLRQRLRTCSCAPAASSAWWYPLCRTARRTMAAWHRYRLQQFSRVRRRGSTSSNASYDATRMSQRRRQQRFRNRKRCMLRSTNCRMQASQWMVHRMQPLLSCACLPPPPRTSSHAPPTPVSSSFCPGRLTWTWDPYRRQRLRVMGRTMAPLLHPRVNLLLLPLPLRLLRRPLRLCRWFCRSRMRSSNTFSCTPPSC